MNTSGPSAQRALRYLNSRGRRIVDLAVALVAFALALPFCVLIAVVILLVDGRPLLFTQERIGRDGVPFRIHKFRTMRVAEDERAGLLDGGARVTRLGESLRRSSIDELPSLLDVIRGRMSLIGPRPLLADHVPLYAGSHPERLMVRPGLTGLAQVTGRKDLSFSERLDRDVAYVRTASPSGDLRIATKTVSALLRGLRRPSEGQIELVDDIGLADAIRRVAVARAREHGSFLEPHGPVGAEASRARDMARGHGGGATSSGSGIGPGPSVVYGTARQALIALSRTAGRMLVPSYYCPDVTVMLRRLAGVPVEEYADDPTSGPSVVRAGSEDLVVVLPHFGRPTQVSVVGGRLLIDASHVFGLAGRGITTDASGRPADVSLASLRKTLPVADGAVVWGDLHSEFRGAVRLDPTHEAAARRLAEALRAKSDLLRTRTGDKRAILGALNAARSDLERLDRPSAALPETVETLARFDLRARWDARERNRAAAVERLERSGLLVPGTELAVFDAPFMLVLVTGSRDVRERLRLGLIGQDVYPAVLWHHDHLAVDSRERAFADRMLALHVDARYSPDDLRRVADIVAEVWRGVSGESK